MWKVVSASCILGVMVLSGCANLTTPSPKAPAQPVTAQEQAVISKEKEQATIRALHKQLQERDRAILLRDQQIDRLSSQLDTLKRIDLDERRREPVRPSVILTP